MAKNYKWTAWEESFLKKNFDKMSGFQIATKLHRTKSSVYSKAYAMGLKKTKAIYNAKPNKTSFKKGNIPHNKGKKGKPNKTSFKKGNVPHNTRNVGDIWILKRFGEKYKWIKTEKGRMLYHRYLWQLNFGAVPKNHVIVFKDGDSMNCDIDNLLCLSRKEHLKRNRDIEKAVRTRKRNQYGSFIKSVLSGI